jgi:hypothetical protein
MVRNIKDVVNDLKNKNMKKAILMFAMAIGMMSCGTINQESSPMKLRQLANVTKTEKSSGGTFVLFFATYHSQEKNTDVIKVFAEVDGLYQFIEIPMSMVKVKIDNSVTTPYIQIRYSYNGPSPVQYSNTQLFDRISIGITLTDYVITCPEQYLPERLLEIDVTK